MLCEVPHRLMMRQPVCSLLQLTMHSLKMMILSLSAAGFTELLDEIDHILELLGLYKSAWNPAYLHILEMIPNSYVDGPPLQSGWSLLNCLGL